jgi:methyl-accepting chemotaxis protein
MKNLSIGFRLSIGFGLLLAVFAGSGLLALGRLATLNEMVDEIVDVRWVTAQKAQEGAALGSSTTLALTRMLVETDPATIRQLGATIDENRRTGAAVTDELEKTLDETGKRSIEELKAGRRKYAESFTRVMALLSGGDREGALAEFNTRLLPDITATMKAWNDVVAHQKARVDVSRKEIDQLYALTRSLMVGLMVGALAVSVAVALYLTRSITGPLLSAVGVADRIARGDLRQAVEVTSRDEVGRLQASMRAMSDKLAEVIGEVRSGPDALAGHG